MREQTVADVGAGPARVRRCKTVGHTPIHHQSRAETHGMARSNTNLPPLSQDTLPARHGLGIETISAPSKRGEASRAYSRQRRIFSTIENDAGPSTTPRHSSQRSASRQPRNASCERQSQGSASSWSTASAFPSGDDACSSAASTPSLTSPSSTLSRSDSLKSAQSPRKHPREHRCISINTPLPTSATNMDRTAEAGMEWSQRARRWSSTMSRKVNIAAINQTLHSTTSPLLRAGIQELRSIFDVDTLGLDDDPFADADLELASPNVARQRPRFARYSSENRLGLRGTQATIDAELVESPDSFSPDLSRQSCSDDACFDVFAVSRKHSDSLGTAAEVPALQSSHQTARSGLEARSTSVRPAHVAVGLTALSMTIVALCAFETTLHPDVASMPLAVFMLAQPAFALLGIVSLAVQKRWLMDLSSRLVRAHVLGQLLIALAAIRSLSGSAFYGQPRKIPSAGLAMMVVNPAAMDSHATRVGSLSDQLTYLLIVLVQAALPLAVAFWAQYAVASSLSRVSRLTSPAKTSAITQSSPLVPTSNDCVSRPTSSPASIQDRKRMPSENESSPNPSYQLETWLGLTVTRLDARPSLSTSQFQLDAQELSKRLERFAFDPLPLQGRDDVQSAIPAALTISA